MRAQSRPGQLWRRVVAFTKRAAVSGGFRLTNKNRLESFAAIAALTTSAGKATSRQMQCSRSRAETI